MIDHHARVQAWLADLMAITAEIDANGARPAPRPSRKLHRKLKPLWEE